MFLKFLFEIVGILTFPKFGAILDAVTIQNEWEAILMNWFTYCIMILILIFMAVYDINNHNHIL